MKLIFGAVLFAIAVVITGGVYWSVRKDDAKQSDLGFLKGLPDKFTSWPSAREYLVKMVDSKPEATIDHSSTDSTPAAA